MLNLFSSQLSHKGMVLNRALIHNKDLPMRRLKLHEYQAAELLQKYKVPVPKGLAASNSKEAFLAAKQFRAGTEFVVKSQVLAGGRGRGHFKENNFQGGVHIVKSAEEVEKIADKMCGKTLVTLQTGEAGIPCNKVYIVEKISIAKEFYLSLTLDRKAGCPTFIYS